jgi:pSer/pThr/pTyr-binding forkhead associated (FHA) protein
VFDEGGMKNEKTQLSQARVADTIVVTRRSLLRIVRGIGAGLEVTLDERPVSAGRTDDADLILDDPAASRSHFVVKAGQGGHVLHDLGSTNGTQVNHTPVLECRLTNGDIITVGETDVAFCEETDVEVPQVR